MNEPSCNTDLVKVCFLAAARSGFDVHSRRDLGGARQNFPWARAQSQYGGHKFWAQNVINGRLFRYQVLKGRPFYN